jgi:hypothetical protein
VVVSVAAPECDDTDPRQLVADHEEPLYGVRRSAGDGGGFGRRGVYSRAVERSRSRAAAVTGGFDRLGVSTPTAGRVDPSAPHPPAT